MTSSESVVGDSDQDDDDKKFPGFSVTRDKLAAHYAEQYFYMTMGLMTFLDLFDEEPAHGRVEKIKTRRQIMADERSLSHMPQKIVIKSQRRGADRRTPMPLQQPVKGRR